MDWSGFEDRRGQSQGHSKVKYLSELLWRAETSTSTLGRRSVTKFVYKLLLQEIIILLRQLDIAKFYDSNRLQHLLNFNGTNDICIFNRGKYAKTIQKEQKWSSVIV